MSMDWTHGLNGDSFFRKDGLLTGPDQHTTVGRNDDGTWYIEIKGRNNARACMNPDQILNMALGILNTLERCGMTIPHDWRRWTPPR